MTKSVYVLSGLGTDERVFQFLDWGTVKPVFIDWIPPYPNESIESYAARLHPQITVPNPILIGLSFGGMVAVELAKQIPVRKLILISSATGRTGIPLLYRIAGAFNLQRVIPTAFLKRANFLTNYLFGVRRPFDQELLRLILRETDEGFLKWAIETIVRWRNMEQPQMLAHLHGTKDRILPIQNVKPDVRVEGGGHLMVLTHAQQVSEALHRILAHD